MCDNQYKDLQDYLREQPDNIKSLNLVAEVTRFLNILYGNVSDKTVQLIIQLIDTLVEFTSGNFHNQAAVFDNKICEYLNHMLRVGDFKGCDDEQLQEVLEYIDSEVLMKTMKRQDGWEKIQGHVEDVGFAYYHVICRKMDLHPSTCTRQALVKTEADKAAWKFFADNTLSIEILKGDVLQKVHFRVKDKNVLREEIKEKFKYSVDRSSPSNKLREFMNWSRDIIKDINAVPDMSDWPGAEYALYTFGGLHNLLSLCIVISYFLCNHPTFPDRSTVPGKAEKDESDEDDEGKSLILVGILGLVIMFMFSLVAFAFFRDKLDEKNGRQCTTAYECFVTIIHHGFVEGMYTVSVMGTFEQQLEDSSFTSALAVSAFDLIFFILITTIGLNIIFGIIVDTFSELRDSKGFEKHVKLEHNQWAYLFFFIHLDETCPNDYSALELHVYKLYDKNNFAFFPLNRALSLAAEEDGNKQKFETLEAAKEREKEKQRQQEWESKHKVRTE
nr:hypothetical protein BaRGS_016339 [Batillaria attramentaria]